MGARCGQAPPLPPSKLEVPLLARVQSYTQPARPPLPALTTTPSRTDAAITYTHLLSSLSSSASSALLFSTPHHTTPYHVPPPLLP
jgi:hypothetical protein